MPGGLAFSEFRGYENWQLIAVAHNGDKLDAVFGNPAMIEAYKVRHSRERQAFPRRRDDGEDPLDGEEG